MKRVYRNSKRPPNTNQFDNNDLELKWFVLHSLHPSNLSSWEAGGVLDPSSQLKIADFTGKGGVEKIMQAMHAGPPEKKKRTNKKGEKKGEDEEKQPKEAYIDIKICLW